MTTKDPISLDRRRSTVAQKEIELRRLRQEIRDNKTKLRAQESELQHTLISSPAETWDAAARKAEYVMQLLADRAASSDPHVNRLVTAVLEDFARLSRQADLPQDL
jgi:hypothetical protein